MKQIVRWALCVLMLMSLFSAAYAAEKEFVVSGDFWYRELKNGVELFSYNGRESEFTIPSKIDGKKVVGLGDNMFLSAKYLEKVVIPRTVEYIGNSTFSKCENLHTVELSNGLLRIGPNAFLGCKQLSSITLPKSLTSIGDYAFEDCYSLSALEIPQKVDFIGLHPFYGVNGVVVNSKNKKYTIVDHALCTKEGDLVAFLPNDMINEYTIPENVVRIMEEAFSHYSFPARVVIPEHVEFIGNRAFYKCSGLIDISLTEGLQVIGDQAFGHCDSLTYISLPDSIKLIGSNPFAGTPIEEIVISANHPMLAFYDNALYSKYNNTLVSYFAIPEYIDEYNYVTVANSHTVLDGIVEIGDYAYFDSRLEEIILPEGLTTISNSAFADCNYLRGIRIPQSVTSIGESAFSYCDRLSAVYIPSNVSAVGANAFMGCRSLRGVIIPDSVLEVGEEAFASCKELTIHTAPNSAAAQYAEQAGIPCELVEHIEMAASALTILGILDYSVTESVEAAPIDWDKLAEESAVTADAAQFAYSLDNGEAFITEYLSLNSNVIIPDEIDGYPVVGIGVDLLSRSNKNPLYYNRRIVSVTIPGSIIKIGSNAFNGCDGLIEINFSEGLISIDDSAFGNLWDIKKIMLPDSLQRIGPAAFGNCPELTSIEIGPNVTKIGDYAFSSCENLVTAVIPSNVESIGKNAFTKCHDDLVIYGEANSAAEEYAAQNGIAFSAVK